MQTKDIKHVLKDILTRTRWCRSREPEFRSGREAVKEQLMFEVISWGIYRQLKRWLEPRSLVEQVEQKLESKTQEAGSNRQTALPWDPEKQPVTTWANQK